MNDLKKIVQTNELDPKDGQIIIDRFGTYEQVAQEWKSKADAIVVTDRSQTTEMAMAREARRKFSNMRIELEKARKAIGEPAYRKYKAVNAVATYLQSLIKPIEEHLKLQEDFIKNDDARIEAEKTIEAERKAEAERLAREEAERKEQERIRKENARLQKEAEERERKMLAEREQARKKAEAKEAELAKVRADALAKQKAMEEKAEKEAEALREQARKAQEAEAEAQRKLEQQQKEVEEARLAKEAEENAIKEAEEARRLEAEKAPEKQKVRDYMRALLNVEAPSVEDILLRDTVNAVREYITNLANEI